jgi:Zn-dependent protease/CBS domain-containing protein
MQSSFRIARVKGIDIRIHFLFALVLIWAALDWGVTRGLGLSGALYGVAFFVLLFVCVTLHELGHSLVARRFGMNVRNITLLPIGGVAQLEGELEQPSHELWMSLAGPLVNLALAALVAPVLIPLVGWRLLGGLDVLFGQMQVPGIERLLIDLFVANVGLAIFNLLPAFPMDGGRVLRSLLASRMGELDATRIATRVGQGLALLLGLAGLVGAGWNLLLIAVFIFAGASQEWQGTQVKAALRRVPAEMAMLRGGVVLSPLDPLARSIDIALRTGQSDFAVFSGGRLVGILTRQDIAAGFERFGREVPTMRVMRTDFPIARADDTLLDLQRKMQVSGSQVISVVDEGRFLGLVTTEGIRNALRLFPARRWGIERA